MTKRITQFLFFIILSASAYAQNNSSREELQKQEQNLRKELDELNMLKNQIQKNKKTTLAQINVIKSKIAKRENLINSIAQQVNLIDKTISLNQRDIDSLSRELDTLKSKYKKSIVFAYKNRSGYEYMNFLFSANNFNDAIKRITYLKNYRQNREAQAKTIALSQKELNEKIGLLGLNKKDRVETMNIQNDQLKVLVDDRKEQTKIISELKGKEKEVTAQLKQKEAQRKKMQAALMTIIKRELAEAERKEKEKLAKQKQANEIVTPKVENTKTGNKNGGKVAGVEGGLTKTSGDRPYSALETTEEGREASISIESSKGALPWPVDKGNVFVHFGVENIPGTKLNRNADYIEIAVPKGSSVKSVANGVVKYTGDINGDLTVIIQHGKYFTMSSHLSSTNVSVGQEVKAGTLLGKSGINLEGEGSLLFILSKEGKSLDPESWLRNRR